MRHLAVPDRLTLTNSSIIEGKETGPGSTRSVHERGSCEQNPDLSSDAVCAAAILTTESRCPHAGGGQSLSLYCPGRSTRIVAHSLPAARLCAVLFLLDEGAAQGSSQTLSKRNRQDLAEQKAVPYSTRDRRTGKEQVDGQKAGPKVHHRVGGRNFP